MPKVSLSRPSDRIPDSALADVAFLLLVFFLATTVIAEEFGLSVILPARVADTPAVQVHPENVLTLTTDSEGRVFFVDGVPTALDEIRNVVRSRQERNGKLVVRVDPDRKAPYSAMVDILDEVKLGGARRISLNTGYPPIARTLLKRHNSLGGVPCRDESSLMNISERPLS